MAKKKAAKKKTAKKAKKTKKRMQFVIKFSLVDLELFQIKYIKPKPPLTQGGFGFYSVFLNSHQKQLLKAKNYNLNAIFCLVDAKKRPC